MPELCCSVTHPMIRLFCNAIPLMIIVFDGGAVNQLLARRLFEHRLKNRNWVSTFLDLRSCFSYSMLQLYYSSMKCFWFLTNIYIYITKASDIRPEISAPNLCKS